MHDTWTHELETWHEFFLLIGTAGVTLTGLLFVVVSLGPRVVANHHATGSLGNESTDGDADDA